MKKLVYCKEFTDLGPVSRLVVLQSSGLSKETIEGLSELNPKLLIPSYIGNQLERPPYLYVDTTEIKVFIRMGL